METGNSTIDSDIRSYMQYIMYLSTNGISLERFFQRQILAVAMFLCGALSVVAQSNATSGMIVANSGETIQAYNIDYSNDYCYYSLTADGNDSKRIKKSDILIIRMDDGTKVDPSEAIDCNYGNKLCQVTSDSNHGSRLTSDKKGKAGESVVFRATSERKIDKKTGTEYIIFADNNGKNAIAMHVVSDCIDVLSVAMGVLPKGVKKYEGKHFIIPDSAIYNNRKYVVEYIDDYPNRNAAHSLYPAYVNVKAIIFPKTLKRIGNYAFNVFCDVDNLILPDGLIEIGKEAFCSAGQYNENFKGIYLPNTIYNIGEEAFIGVGSKCSPRGFYQGYIESMPDFIGEGNCNQYGIDEEAVRDYYRRNSK